MTYSTSIWDHESPFGGLSIEVIRNGIPVGQDGSVVLVTDDDTAAVVALASVDPSLPGQQPMTDARALVVGQWLILRLTNPLVAAPEAPALDSPVPAAVLDRIEQLQTQVDDLTAMVLMG